MTAVRDDERIVFLAMFWGGGGPFGISAILHACDWVNRAVPRREDLEAALNALLARGLIEAREGEFVVRDGPARDFDALRKRIRKGKFEAVEQFFRRLPEPGPVPRTVTISESEYERHLADYVAFLG